MSGLSDLLHLPHPLLQSDPLRPLHRQDLLHLPHPLRLSARSRLLLLQDLSTLLPQPHLLHRLNLCFLSGRLRL